MFLDFVASTSGTGGGFETLDAEISSTLEAHFDSEAVSSGAPGFHFDDLAHFSLADAAISSSFL